MKSKFNIGDRVFSLMYGWGVIVDITDGINYPVTVEHDDSSIGAEGYTFDGRYFLNCKSRSLFIKEEVENNPDIRRFLNFLLFEDNIEKPATSLSNLFKDNIENSLSNLFKEYTERVFRYRGILYVCVGFKYGVLLDNEGNERKDTRRVLVETKNSLYPLEECVFIL